MPTGFPTPSELAKTEALEATEPPVEKPASRKAAPKKAPVKKAAKSKG